MSSGRDPWVGPAGCSFSLQLFARTKSWPSHLLRKSYVDFSRSSHQLRNQSLTEDRECRKINESTYLDVVKVSRYFKKLRATRCVPFVSVFPSSSSMHPAIKQLLVSAHFLHARSKTKPLHLNSTFFLHSFFDRLVSTAFVHGFSPRFYGTG